MPAQTRGGKKRQRVLDVNNIPEQLTVGGNPRASGTLVFTHGFGGDQSVWRDVAPSREEVLTDGLDFLKMKARQYGLI